MRATICGRSQFRRIRPFIGILSNVPGSVVLKASDYIPAGGTTATTAQLTAPTGKSSGTDFEQGYISDDTNPHASFNPGSGKYSEWEVCVEVKSALVASGDEIEFRMTNAGTPFDTYSKTPKWTIGTGVYALLPIHARVFDGHTRRHLLTR